MEEEPNVRGVVKRLEGVLQHIRAPIMLTKADARRSQWSGTSAFFRKLSVPVTKKTTKRRRRGQGQLGEGGVAAWQEVEETCNGMCFLCFCLGLPEGES